MAEKCKILMAGVSSWVAMAHMNADLQFQFTRPRHLQQQVAANLPFSHSASKISFLGHLADPATLLQQSARTAALTTMQRYRQTVSRPFRRRARSLPVPNVKPKVRAWSLGPAPATTRRQSNTFQTSADLLADDAKSISFRAKVYICDGGCVQNGITGGQQGG